MLLKFCTAFEPYCREHTAAIRPERIAEFLLFDAEFPHSVRFSVDRICEALGQCRARRAARAPRAGCERLAGRLKAAVDFGQIDELTGGTVDTFLVNVSRQCEQIHDAVYAAYIAYDAEAVLCGRAPGLMHYSIRHITQFRYSAPVRESVMELRMQPRSEGPQTLRNFQIATNPRAQLYAYTDHLGNAVYHFNVLREAFRAAHRGPVRSSKWTRCPPQPEAADALEWEPLQQSQSHAPSITICWSRRNSPAVRRRCSHSSWRHTISTKPEGRSAQRAQASFGDDLRSLRLRDRRHRGAFAHRARARGRTRRVPGFRAHHDRGRARLGHPGALCLGLSPSRRARTRTAPAEDATHAWVEAWLPSFGWIGFDPTNDIMAGERHIRVAVGRDYADVPPTRGTFKGKAESELAIAVSVQPTQAPVAPRGIPARGAADLGPRATMPAEGEHLFHQQQQQQQ